MGQCATVERPCEFEQKNLGRVVGREGCDGRREMTMRIGIAHDTRQFRAIGAHRAWRRQTVHFSVRVRRANLRIICWLPSALSTQNMAKRQVTADVYS